MRLTASGLMHRYRPDLPYVLAGVDIEINAGEAVAITGPSGSGKTTLLALLGGLLPPQQGTVRYVDAQNAPHPPGNWVAWVLQTVNVLADRTVADNVALGGLSRRMSRSDAELEADRWLAVVGLGGRAGDPVRDLSGGEVQRVVIARALASGRPVLLADEPTGQLDAATTEWVLDALLDQAHGRTVVVVTHDPSVAAQCDRVLRLRDGRLHQEPA